METEPPKNKTVNWKVFIWMIGVIVIVFGWIFAGMAAINGKLENHQDDMTEIKIFMSSVKADLIWIKAEIQKINNK